MNFSDVIPFLSGLLLFALAGYSVRLARIFSAVRTGWLVFSSLAFLALLYLVLLASPFRGTLLWGARADITYALISLVLLVAMVRLESLFKARLRKESAAENSVSEWQSTAEKQYEKLAEAHKELQETKNRIEAELAEQERLHEEARNNSSELLTASGQTEQELQQANTSLREQVEEYRRKLETAEHTHQEELAAARGVVEELEKAANTLRAEIVSCESETAAVQEKSDRLQAEIGVLQAKYEERQGMIERLEEELKEQQQSQKEAAKAQRDLVNASRQKGKTELASSLFPKIGRLRTSIDSVTLAAEHLAQSSQARLVQSGRLLQDHNPISAGSMRVRGRTRRVLPDCINHLTRHLSDQHDVLVRRIDSLKKKTEEIQALVIRHQSSGRLPNDAKNLAAFSDMDNGPANGAAHSGVVSDEAILNGEARNSIAPEVGQTETPDLQERLINSVTETGTETAEGQVDEVESAVTDEAALEEPELRSTP